MQLSAALLFAACNPQPPQPVRSVTVPPQIAAVEPCEAGSPPPTPEDASVEAAAEPPKGAIVLNKNLLRPDIRREHPTLLGDPAQILPAPDVVGVGGRHRKPTAVLLFAPPSEVPRAGMFTAEPIVFQPLVCSIRGKLETGLACGEAMPARVHVRVATDENNAELETMTLERSKVPFRDADRVLPPPYGPMCCMYNGCQGKTVPYHVADRALTTTKTLLAVWPEDADIDLRPNDSGATAVTWKRPLNVGADAEYLLSTSDVDGDGRSEFVVYEKWRNAYSLYVASATSVLYRFSCGNL